jgi:hypothetical protein
MNINLELIDTTKTEHDWLVWLMMEPLEMDELVKEARQFVAEMEPYGEVEMASWIARYGKTRTWGEICAAVKDYISPARPSTRPLVPPPPVRRPVQYTAPQLQRPDPLLNQLLTQPRQGVPQTQLYQKSKWLSVAGIFWVVCTCITFFMGCYLTNKVVQGIFHRDIPNEVKIALETRKIEDFAWDEDGKYIAWEDGSIVFYNHDWTCIPSFRAFDDQGQQLPPPSEWPAQDAPALLVSEYKGCASWARYSSWGGYWGKTDWGEYVVQEGGKDTPLWVEFGQLGVTRMDFKNMATKDLSLGGVVGQTVEVGATPTDARVPTAPPVQPPPPVQQPIQDQQPAQPPPPVQQQQVVEAPMPTNTPWVPLPTPVGQSPAQPYVEQPATTLAPFATQTAIPVPQPTADLVAAAAILHAAQTAQAVPPVGLPAPTQPGHLQAPQSTPNVVVKPGTCLSCHN